MSWSWMVPASKPRVELHVPRKKWREIKTESRPRSFSRFFERPEFSQGKTTKKFFALSICSIKITSLRERFPRYIDEDNNHGEQKTVILLFPK